jgi:hypothetical protein
VSTLQFKHDAKLPTGPYVPGTHNSHTDDVDAPTTALKRPATHPMHTTSPSTSAKVPFGQLVQAVAPACALYDPTLQFWHTDPFEAPTMLLHIPGAHIKQVAKLDAPTVDE